jgi:hypothetical protein
MKLDFQYNNLGNKLLYISLVSYQLCYVFLKVADNGEYMQSRRLRASNLSNRYQV